MKQLDWEDLWTHLGMNRDNGGRWYPGNDTPESVKEYLTGYRSPSRAWPNSYATPLLTKKFCKYLAEKEPQLFAKIANSKKEESAA